MHCRQFFIALSLLLMSAGCADNASDCSPDAALPDAGRGPRTLTLTLNLNTAAAPATRAASADTDDDPQRPGVTQTEADENNVNSIDLFLEDADADPDRSGMKAGKARLHFDHITRQDGNTITLHLSSEQAQQVIGRKNVYIGVNLSDAQAEQFAAGNEAADIAAADAAAQGFGLMEAFAPSRGIGLPDFSGTAAGRQDLAMFGTEGQEMNFAWTTNAFQLPEAFTLRRLTAKVLTTCRTDADGYCTLRGALLYPDDYEKEELRGKGRGWIRQADVRYLINGLNLRSYVMQRREWNINKGAYDIFDPNYDHLGDYFRIDEHGGLLFPTLESNFFYRETSQLLSSWADFAPTLPFDEAKVPVYDSPNTDKYFEGIYCPENTFTNAGLTDEQHQQLTDLGYPWPMFTHVSIAAKFTPRQLCVETDLLDDLPAEAQSILTPERQAEIAALIAGGTPLDIDTDNDGAANDIVVVDCASAAASHAILALSLTKHDMFAPGANLGEETDKFPNDTYLSGYDDRAGYDRYYTYGAAYKVAAYVEGGAPANRKQLASFKAVPGGVGFYFTYLDNRPDSDPAKAGSAPAYTDCQVERNNYYILTLNSFSTTGSTGTEPDYIKVHTRVVDWQPGGSGTATLD